MGNKEIVLEALPTSRDRAHLMPSCAAKISQITSLAIDTVLDSLTVLRRWKLIEYESAKVLTAQCPNYVYRKDRFLGRTRHAHTSKVVNVYWRLK